MTGCLPDKAIPDGYFEEPVALVYSAAGLQSDWFSGIMFPRLLDADL